MIPAKLVVPILPLPSKKKSSERIDGIVALIMALDCATRHADNYAGGSVWVVGKADDSLGIPLQPYEGLNHMQNALS